MGPVFGANKALAEEGVGCGVMGVEGVETLVGTAGSNMDETTLVCILISSGHKGNMAHLAHYDERRMPI
jgi:hypothetical protein